MSQPRIGVVDYGAGNILNVVRAIEHLDSEPELVNSPDALRTIDGIVIPGVGAFGAGMHGLAQTGMDEALRDFTAQGVPLLAICLGMQLLAASSEESPGVAGLGLIDGHVKKLTPEISDTASYRVPDTGWASVTFSRHSLGFTATERPNFYFSHSYYFAPDDGSVVSATKNRQSLDIPVLLEQGNVVGAQFHPEKSGPDGITLLRAWIESAVR